MSPTAAMRQAAPHFPSIRCVSILPEFPRVLKAEVILEGQRRKCRYFLARTGLAPVTEPNPTP
jgi:hypothetical protein